MVDDGQRLLQALDVQNFPVSGALWLYDQDSTIWKLIIVSDVANAPGPLEAYMRIQSAMPGPDLTFALDDIIVMSPQSKAFHDLRRTIEGVTKSFLTQQVHATSGISFEDAFVYRWPE